MSTTLRTLLLIASVITAIWILRKIRKNGIKQEDALFWICFAIVLAVLGIFPKVSYMMAELFGIQAPSNFVFMTIIAILIEKLFSLSIQISWLENKVDVMAAELAIRCKNIEDNVNNSVPKNREKVTERNQNSSEQRNVIGETKK